MFWLTLIVGMQFLGFGITLGRLVYDEWQQRRLSRSAQKIDWGSPDPEKVMSIENALPLKGDAKGHRMIYPHLVPCDPNLNLNEKRPILAAWTYDGQAVDSALRHLPSTLAPVTFSSIMDVPPQLDSSFYVAGDHKPPPLPPALRIVDSDLHLEAA